METGDDVKTQRAPLETMWLCLAVLLCALGGCAYLYSFDEPELRGQVVDEVNGKPVSGAIVAAYWGVQDGNLAGNSWVSEYVHFFEGTTDDKGEFVIPAWSERRLIKGKIADQFPSILIYRPGYRLVKWQGRSVRHWPHGPVSLRKSENDNETQRDMHQIKYWFGPGIGGCMWQNFAKLYWTELQFRYAMRIKYVPEDLRYQYKYFRFIPKSNWVSPNPSIGQLVSESGMFEEQQKVKESFQEQKRAFGCVDPMTFLK